MKENFQDMIIQQNQMKEQEKELVLKISQSPLLLSLLNILQKWLKF